MEVHLCSVGEAMEEMGKEFRGQVAHTFASERGAPDKPRTAAEIDGNTRETVVHGQDKAIAGQTELGAKCLTEGGTQDDGHIFYRVVLVDMEVATTTEGKVEPAMARQLHEHVVEEADTGVDVGLSAAVETEGEVDVGFTGLAADMGGALAEEQGFGGLLPCVAVTDSDEAAAKIAGQEGIAVAVTDNVAVGEVIAAGGVAGKHGCAGLARGSAVGRPCSVDEESVRCRTRAS